MRRHYGLGCAGSVLIAALLGIPAGSVAQSLAATDLRALSLEELGNIEVTSVSRQAERLSDAPAAVYVITNEDIRRSGQTSLPEILRLAPNLEVAQVSNNSYAITARGFNSTAANKLLVLIDGRSVYTPLFSGVFWDVQDVLPEDIERIEVISGPGGTLWGANAVNGVINIITKNSRDTQGGLATFGAGNTKIDGGVRYGGKLGPDATYRIYAKGFWYGDSSVANGPHLHDAWNKPQGGFRIDWGRGLDALTLQGDAYGGSESEASGPDLLLAGRNLLSRWTRRLGNGLFQLQAYYDYANRSTFNDSVISEVTTYDIEAQHSFSPLDRHEVVWGADYRLTEDRVAIASGVFLLPVRRDLNLGSLFAQDSIALTASLKLILGLRLEDNSYTGLAPLPSARLAWKVFSDSLLWSAVSRAVRTPSRIDHDLFETVGATTVVAGGPSFKDETLTAYELGWRQQLGSRISLSVSGFYNSYDDLRSFELSPAGGLPLLVANRLEGHSYGLEVWGDYRVADWWRLKAGFNLLHESLRFKAGSNDPIGKTAEGDDPRHQLSLRSEMNITDEVELDLGVRQIGRLPAPAIPSYVSFDTRVGWKFLQDVEASVSVTNLFDHRHQEFGSLPLQFGAPPLHDIGRTVFVAVRGRY